MLCLLLFGPHSDRSYLEADGGDAIIQPWVWILGLFVGPVSTSLCYQSYLFFAVWFFGLIIENNSKCLHPDSGSSPL